MEKVLVLDDDSGVRNIHKYNLEVKGKTAVVTTTVGDALLQVDNVSSGILDWKLEGTDGKYTEEVAVALVVRGKNVTIVTGTDDQTGHLATLKNNYPKKIRVKSKSDLANPDEIY